jgi:membrane protease YdiL (CAAX protease family)
MQTYLKSRPIWIQLSLFIGMAFGIFICLSIFGALILSNVTGISLFQLQDTSKWDPNNPGMIVFIRGLLVLQFLGLFVIPSMLFAYFADPHPAQYLGLKAPKRSIYLILGILAMIVAIPAVEYTGVLNQQMSLGGEAQKWMKHLEEDATKQIQFMLNKRTPKELIFNLIFISLFAGIGEEIFFRGILQRLFIRAFKNPWAGIIMTAIIFSGFHLQFFGFVPRLLLGVLLGAVYWYSGSLWTAIIAHFIYDGMIIVIAYFVPSMVDNPNASMIDPAKMTGLALISTILTVLTVVVMKKISTVSYSEVYKDDKPPKDPFTF